jgi:hypothetical protein
LGSLGKVFFRSGTFPSSEEAAQPGYEPAKPTGQRDRNRQSPARAERHHSYSYMPSWGAWARPFFLHVNLPFGEQTKGTKHHKPGFPRSSGDLTIFDAFLTLADA